ncbi:MAG: hypothetical protein UHS49_05540 [Faecalimonas sp.]|nr:hypothetical protein [Faecalimonas sp.]
MKRCLTVVLLVLSLSLCGCSYFEYVTPELEEQPSETEAVVREELDEGDIYPFYNSLTNWEKNVYIKICDAIENFETEGFQIDAYDSKAECDEAIERIEDIYAMLVYEHPEYFWVNLSEYQTEIWSRGERYYLKLKMSYLMDEAEAEAKQDELNLAVDRIVQGAQMQANTFERVLYVYDEILKNVVYDEALVVSTETAEVGRSAYGCLVQGKTVCSGYSLAFNLIMQKLGYQVGAEFDVHCETELAQGHVWNYAKLDGEYYYFDLTWDDIAMSAQEGVPFSEYTHQYFGITKEELRATHDLSEKVMTPPCLGTTYDYFKFRNLYTDVYDYKVVKQILRGQEGQKMLAVKFGSQEECARAEQDLIENQRIFDIYKDAESFYYVMSESKRHLYIMFS